MDWLHWTSLVFVIPLLLAALYLCLLAVGLTAADDLDGHDHDQAHVDADASAIKALAFLGLGKVPLSILLTCFCLLWGLAGLASLQVLRGLPGGPDLAIWPALVVALVVAGGLTRLLAQGLARYFPGTESYAVSDQQLVGKLARARYAITESHGRALVRTDSGTLLEVSCRVQPGEAPIADGASILLVNYDEEQRTFLVAPDPFGTDTLDRRVAGA